MRQVISAASGREVAQPAKPHYNAVADEDQRKHKAAVEVAKKAAAKKKRSALEAKRAKAQQALEAAAAELSKLDAR